MKTSRGCYDAQLFRRCAGRIVMVSCCCVCPQFFLSALPPRGSINNKHFCNNFQQKQIITLSGIDNVVSCYLSKNHNLQQHEKSKNLQKKLSSFVPAEEREPYKVKMCFYSSLHIIQNRKKLKIHRERYF